LAAQFLKDHGYTILKRNFLWKRGEVDIIAKKNKELSFVEVKTYDEIDFSEIEYALNRDKRKRIINTSQYFLFCYPDYRNCRIKFSLIFINLDSNRIRYIENAFTENGVP